MKLQSFPFEAVLWDMDGTLIDSEPIWIEEEERLMRDFGVNWTKEDSLHCLGGPMERVDSYMRQRAGNQHAPLVLTDLLIDRMVSRLNSNVAFTPGADKLLEHLHLIETPMALVTASSRRILEAAMGSVGMHYFKHTISADDVVKSKPDPEGYIAAANLLGVSIENSLVIEDSQTGITAAINAGAYVLGLPHIQSLPTGPKVVHRNHLRDLDSFSLAALFEGIMAK